MASANSTANRLQTFRPGPLHAAHEDDGAGDGEEQKLGVAAGVLREPDVVVGQRHQERRRQPHGPARRPLGPAPRSPPRRRRRKPPRQPDRPADSPNAAMVALASRPNSTWLFIEP